MLGMVLALEVEGWPDIVVTLRPFVATSLPPTPLLGLRSGQNI